MMRPAPARRLFVVPLAAACLAAAIGAAVLWVRPPHTRSTSGPPATVIGEPGSPVPPGARPARPGAPDDLKPYPAPAFALTVLSSGSLPSSTAALIPAAGGRLALSALRGHPVVINFWGSWCGPCRAEMPLLVKTWHAYAERGVVIVGFDVDDTPAEARRFLQAYGVDYPIVAVPDERLPRAYNVIGVPTTVFVDASGMIRAREVGGFAGAEGERTLTRRLDALLAGYRR